MKIKINKHKKMEPRYETVNPKLKSNQWSGMISEQNLF